MSVLSTGGKGQMTPDWAFHIGVWCSAASKGFISSADFNGFEVHKVSVCLDRIGGNVFPLVVFFLSSVFLRFFFWQLLLTAFKVFKLGQTFAKCT